MTTSTGAGRPALARGVRLVHDPVRGEPALLYPEGVLLLNESSGEILSRCDGTRTPAGIAADLADTYEGVAPDDVTAVVASLVDRRLIEFDPPSPRPVEALPEPSDEHRAPPDPVPVGMLAELTYRCPLHCPYCSNPVNTGPYREELDTAGWLRALDEARALGVLQVHFSGGEPMLRRDLPLLVARASSLGIYTNLITSGIPMDEPRLAALKAAGLDHVQLSVQDSVAASADQIAGLTAHERKLAVARWVVAQGLPLTVNAVLHRANIDRVLDIADLAATMGADRLELANTQYYGWGLRNRAALMPSAEQVAAGGEQASEARARYGDRMEIVYVIADHHRARPKACMAGWGSRQLVVAPNGDVLPCLAAGQLPDLGIENLRTASLAQIWYDSPSFNRFRGTDWMQEPCRSCPLASVDLGGCRCQAYQITGDPAATDPVCELSPQHGLVTALLATPPGPVLQQRRSP